MGVLHRLRIPLGAWLMLGIAPVVLGLGVRPLEEDAWAGLEIERGESLPSIVIPRDETLDYNVRLNVAVVGNVKVGNFQLASKVEPYQQGLSLGGPMPASLKERGHIVAKAWGEHLGYSLDHNIHMTWQPMEWPNVVYRDVQKGSENRQRELRYGVQDGQPMAWYQSDRHCKGCKHKAHYTEGTWFTKSKHCKKCKRPEHRVLREPTTREIPEGAVDMLGAVYLARQMMRTGVESAAFPLLDREDTWNVQLKRGKRAKRKVPGGSFWCREMKLSTQSVPGSGKSSKKRKFEGLFGIQGTISIWLDEATGVPVEISGVVPLGPMKLDVSIGLSKFRGTPAGFGPVRKG